MLKLIRLAPEQGMFTIQGFGCPKDAVLVGTLGEARQYLHERIGVQKSELDLAEEYLRQRPDHNAVDFGVTGLRVTSSLSIDTTDLCRRMGMGPSGKLS